LEEAIKCAYYRCYEGCEGAIEEVNSQIFDCSEFCAEAMRDDEGKICDEDAKLHPVKVSLKKDQVLIFKKLHSSSGYVNDACEKKSGKGGCTPSITIHAGLIVDGDLDKHCKEGDLPSSFRLCSLREGDYFIWAEGTSCMFGPKGTPFPQTILCGHPTSSCSLKDSCSPPENCCEQEDCLGCAIHDYDDFHGVCYNGETTNQISYSWIDEPKLHYGKDIPCCEADDCPDYYCYTWDNDEWMCRTRINELFRCIDNYCTPYDSPVTSARNTCFYTPLDFGTYDNRDTCFSECKKLFEETC